MFETIKYWLWKCKHWPCNSFQLLWIWYTTVWYVSRYVTIAQNIYYKMQSQRTHRDIPGVSRNTWTNYAKSL